jgi:hypothetical protein
LSRSRQIGDAYRTTTLMDQLRSPFRKAPMTSPSSQSQELPVPPTANDLFKLGSRPAQVIEHPSWNAARDRIMSLVSGGPSLIALLGSPGSGKTTLLRDLGGKLGERGYAARLLEFADSPLGGGPAEVVLVDEADHMSATRLETLCRRSDATIILAALPAFAKHLQDHSAGVAIVSLTALSPDEAFAFVAERLAQLELPVTCLTEAAWAQLINNGNGVPRLLFALLNLTLLIATEKQAERATEVHVELATEVRNGIGGGPDDEPIRKMPDFAEPDAIGRIPGSEMFPNAGANAGKRTRRPWYGTVAGAVCLVAAVALLIWWRMDETASSGPNASPVSVGLERAKIDDAKTDKVGVLSPLDGTATSPLERAWTTEPDAAATAALAPAVQSSAPAGANESRAASQALVAPVQSSMPTTSTVEQPPAPAATISSNAAPRDAKVPTAAAGTNLPAGAVIRVVLTYPHGDMAAAKRGAELARVLRTDGLGVGDPFPVAPQLSKKGISYYFSQDAGAATDLGQRLYGAYGKPSLARVPRAAGQPRPGTIEIALGSD